MRWNDHATLAQTLSRNQPALQWLARLAETRIACLPGSVEVGNLPVPGVSGAGQLVVTASGESAFVVDSGVHWHIPNLWDGVDQVLLGESGDLTIHLTDPASILITIRAPDGTALLEALQSGGLDGLMATDSVEKGVVGLFSRGRRDEPVAMAFPGGVYPDLSSPALRSDYFTMTPSRRAREGIAKDDVMSYMDAGYAHALGIPNDEQILAWGPVTIRTALDDRTYDGDAVVTSEQFLAWWLPSSRGLVHTIQVSHGALIGLQPADAHVDTYHWSTGIYADDAAKHIVQDPVIMLGTRLGKDPHANRRAETLSYTLKWLLK